MNAHMMTRADSLSTNAHVTAELLNDFAEYIDAAPRTVEAYKKNLRYFAEYLARQGITQPQRQDVINYRDELKANYKANTVQAYFIPVRLFFQWTGLNGYYPNIAEHIKAAKIDTKHRKDYLTSAQLKKIIAGIDRSTLKGKRDYAMFILMLTGGLRTVEVHRANIEDIKPLGDDIALYIRGKGRDDKAEYVKITPETEQAIRDYLNARGATVMQAPLFVSLSNNGAGTRLSTRSISGTIKSMIVNAGYNSERLTAHSLRHSAVTLSLIGGRPIDEVSQFARHSSITTTQVYAHNLSRAANKCEQTIEQSIFA